MAYWNDFGVIKSTILRPDPISKEEKDFRKEYELYPFGNILPDSLQGDEIERMRNKAGFRTEKDSE